MIVSLEWRLRKIMAEKGIWSGSELGRLMKDKTGYSLSAPSISALLTNKPKQVKAETMDALCTTLECTPGDLWKHTPSLVKNLEIKHIRLAKVSSETASIDKLPPI